MLLPIVIYAIFQETRESTLLALVLFSLIMLSDFLDGYFARKRREVSEAGSFLDPVSDKIVVISLLVVFLAREQFWLFPLLIFIIRDIVVNGIRSIGAKHDIIISSDIYGNIETVFQFLIIFGILLNHFFIFDGHEGTIVVEGLDLLIWLLTALAVILALLSMINYSYKCWVAIRNQKAEGKSLAYENMIILANRKSRGYHDGLRRRLLKLFVRKRNAEIKYISPEQGMFKEVKNEIKKYSQIVIAGGDGSFESALNYPLLKRKRLGFFPLGAGNAFYSYFYKGKRFVYLKSNFQFREAELDVLKVECELGSKETLFLSIGIDAEVLQYSKKRTVSGLKDYIAGAWKSLWRARADYDLDLIVDRKKVHWENCVNLTLGKVPYYGYGIKSIIHSISNDGLVYGQGIVNKHSTLLNKFLRLWCLLIVPLSLDYPPLVPLQGKEITIKSEVPFPIQVGGDFWGYSQYLKVKVIRKQKVLVI